MEREMSGDTRSGGGGENRPRSLSTSLVLAVLCGLSWWLMGGAELLATAAERRGAGTVGLLVAAGFGAFTAVLYGGMRLFHRGRTRMQPEG